MSVLFCLAAKFAYKLIAVIYSITVEVLSSRMGKGPMFRHQFYRGRKSTAAERQKPYIQVIAAGNFVGQAIS